MTKFFHQSCILSGQWSCRVENYHQHWVVWILKGKAIPVGSIRPNSYFRITQVFYVKYMRRYIISQYPGVKHIKLGQINSATDFSGEALKTPLIQIVLRCVRNYTFSHYCDASGDFHMPHGTLP